MSIDFSKIRAIIFDLDDTLIPSSFFYKKTLEALNIDDNLYNKARSVIKNRLGKDHVSSHSRYLYFKEYLYLKKIFSVEIYLNLVSEYEKILVSYIKEYWVNSETKLFLYELKEKYNLRYVVLTNETTLIQAKKLSAIDPIAELFDAYFTSEDLGLEKPNENTFKFIIKYLMLDSNEILMIGDNLTFDISPAKRLGLQTVKVDLSKFNYKINTILIQ